MTTISITEETKKLIISKKIYPRETYDETLNRILKKDSSEMMDTFVEGQRNDK